MSTILNFGSVNIDHVYSVPHFVRPGETLASLSYAVFSGGKGSALRTLVGVLTVTAISSGMNMAGVNPLWKNVVYGCVLIAAVAINSEKGGRDLIIK